MSKLELLFSPLLMWPILSAVLVGLLAGSVGSFLVWRRMGLFADAIAHASLPVAATATLIGWPVSALIAPFAVLFSLYLSWLDRRGTGLSNLLPILYSGLFGAGIVLVTQFGLPAHMLLDLAIGDLLLVGSFDFGLVAVVSLLAFFYLRFRWRDLVLISLNSELAVARGLAVSARSAELMALLGLVVASGLRLTGVVLMTSLLTVPAMISGQWVRGLRSHFVFSAGIGLFLSSGGLILAVVMDWPTGPSVAILGVLSFAASSLISKMRHRV